MSAYDGLQQQLDNRSPDDAEDKQPPLVRDEYDELFETWATLTSK